MGGSRSSSLMSTCSSFMTGGVSGLPLSLKLARMRSCSTSDLMMVSSILIGGSILATVCLKPSGSCARPQAWQNLETGTIEHCRELGERSVDARAGLFTLGERCTRFVAVSSNSSSSCTQPFSSLLVLRRGMPCAITANPVISPLLSSGGWSAE